MDAVELTRMLVRTESTNPGTGEAGMEKIILDFLRESGAETEEYEVFPGRSIVRGMIRGKQRHPALVFLCHMDTVVVGEGWSEDPFSARVSEGRILGRGSCDMKSGLACALTAFCEEAERRKTSELRPEHSIVFIGTVDEEGDMAGAEAAVSQKWISPEDWVLDMEPTSGMIQMAHKGRTWFELECRGITAHASMPEKGADAIAGIAFMITEIRRLIGMAPSHPELGRSTVTFGEISGGYSPYVVSDYCRVTIDMRLVPPLNTAEAEKMVRAAVRKGEEAVPGVKGEIHITGDRPPVETHRESRLLKMLAESVETVTGRKAEVSSFPGYTDTAVVAGMTGNRNCMSYGPGSLAQAHKPDEYVEISDIERCVSVCRELIRRVESD